MDTLGKVLYDECVSPIWIYYSIGSTKLLDLNGIHDRGAWCPVLEL